MSSANRREEGKSIVRRGTYKRQVFLFLALLTGLLVSTASVVAYFDPLWCTGITHEANRITPVIDARLQKTSRLIRGHNNYDALVMGSSRVEQLRQEDFAPLKVFNYAAPSFYPDEYEAYLDQFLHCNGSNTRTVFLGLDFYGTNIKLFEHAKSPSYYIKTCSAPLYPLKTFLSGDSIKYSMKMFRGKRDMFNYDRMTLDKLTKVVDRNESDALLEKQLAQYEEKFYGDYSYNPNYRSLLQGLKERHPHIRFIVFTTPETEQLFRVLVSRGRFSDYRRWLEDIVEVFGGVYNLMIPGPFAADRENFLDAHHLYPDRAAPVVRLITGKPQPGDDTAGCYVTRDTIKQHLGMIAQTVEQLKKGTTP